jgi:hypothetical protein
VPTTDHFSDGQKRTMLENAVAPITELRQVKNNADLEKTRTGSALTFNEYTNLLLSASAAYDQEFQPKQSKRLVYAHDFGDAYDDSADDCNEGYSIDACVQVIQANAHNRTMPRSKQKRAQTDQRVRMPLARWSKLSPKDRIIWDQLDDTSNAAILGVSSPTSGPSLTHPSTRHVNLHEISAYDYLQANLHETGLDTTEGDSEEYHEAKEVEDYNDAADTTILVNSSTSRVVPSLTPGDIRRVMSTASTRFAGSKQTSNPTLEARMHMTYVVSKHQSTNQHSLVDRGSNGGVAGN